jgi:hypothetical protein
MQSNPGESQRRIPGEKLAFSWVFLGFYGPEALKLLFFPNSRRKLPAFSDTANSLLVSRGRSPFGSGVQGDEPPMTACDGNFIRR